MPTDLDRLLEEAERQPFEGWDFSWLEGRMRVEPLPWDFEALASAHARQSPDLLDMGTGGGERLSRLMGRPARTVATEAWAPNVPVAGRRLLPLGIGVVQDEGAPDNTSQGAETSPRRFQGRLPFRGASFHLVTNRLEAFVASEVARVLAPGGVFLTQQIDNDWARGYYRLLGLPAPPRPPIRWALKLAVAQVEAAGLEVVARGVGDEGHAYLDVGALAWYLKVIPWAIPGFSIERFRPRLAQLHAQILSDGPLTVSVPHFWLEARRRAYG
ncbi:MAG TPA: class I SAM-dependent methyltransferase [Chloroflexota bacterium]|nr:class I SAM-dependent methyltransferase [Chloroflexota bacterium]